MPSYEPVDLSDAGNAGTEVLGDAPGDVPLGQVDLRGLPFQIGSERPSAERCFVLPGAPTSVEIGRLAPRVIVAHRLLEPGAPAGHAVGRTVAEYAFHLAGGEVVTAPIRERFEIQVVPPEWGRLPFLAVTDTSDYKLTESGRNWVHVRVVDDATGQPVPCRVHFRSAEGIPYQPHGHHNHVTQNLDSWHYDVGGDLRLGQRSYAYIDGTCQGWLPRGDVVAEVARGFEYEPLRQTVRIGPGQRDLTLRLGRVADMAAEGWWSGDSHVHFLSTPGAQLEQRGEDLRVVNLLQAQWGALFTNTEDFSGRPSVVDGGGYVTYVGQENRQHALGHALLWGLREPVMPWSSDGPDEAELGGALDATLSDWADRTHAQGGTVVAALFPDPNGEPAVLVATGRADAVEILSQTDDRLLEYYRYLNSGYRLPLVGGTDKMSSAVPVGLYRTYARLDEEFSYEAWCRAVRSGRTFLSGGPLVTLSVDGSQPGDTVALSGPGTVSVQATVRSIFPLRSFEVVRNGEVVMRTDTDGGRQADISGERRIDGNSWIACRAFGAGYHLDEWGRRVFAHTSPVYVACGGEWTMADPEGLRYIRTLVEGAREYVRHTAVRRSDQFTTHHHGEAEHLAWLERPFAEALRALEERDGG